MLKTVLALVLCLLLFVAGDYFLFFWGIVRGPGQAIRLIPDYLPVRGVILFIATIAGMIGKVILDALKRKERVFFLIKLALKETFASLVISPIVFLFFYTISRDQPDVNLLTTILFAFENGFVCKAVIEK